MRIAKCIGYWVFSGFLAISAWSESQDESDLVPSARIALPAGPAAQQGDGALSAIAALVNTGSQVNEFTGQASFSIPLASVGNHGGVRYSVNLQYFGGGIGDKNAQQHEFSPTSWVGEGFGMSAPFIFEDNKGTVDLGDDTYMISLDGLTQTELIPETGNPDVFVPKSNPYMKVQRFTATIAGAQYIEPLATPVTTSFSYTVAKYWELISPDGMRFRFGADLSCNDIMNPVLCQPVTGKRFGYFPFFNYNENAKRPFQWYLKDIKSKDGRFAIFFEYQKIQAAVSGITYSGGVPSPVSSLDRAIYLKSIYSVNGNAETATRLDQVEFIPEDKPASQYLAVARNPLTLFETKRLKAIEMSHTGNLIRKYNFSYDASENDKTRLKSITEEEGVFNSVRPFKKFDYYEDKPWQIKRVTDRSGLSWEYGYANYEYPATGTVRPPPQVVNLRAFPIEGANQDLIPDFINPKISYRAEVKGRYYMLVEDSGTGALRKPRLFEFEPRSTYWKMNRVFISPFNGNNYSSVNKNDFAFSFSPAGEYFVFTSGSDIRLYDAQFEGLEATNIDLGGSLPSGFQLGSFTNSHVTSSIRSLSQVYAFRDWMAIYTLPDVEGNLVNQNSWKATLYFYYKTSTGWKSTANQPGDGGGAGGCSGIVPFTPLGFNFERITGCLVWERPSTYGFPEVKPGGDFITLVYRHWSGGPSVNGSAIRIFSFDRELGKIKANTSGLGTSWAQKGGAPANAENWTRWYGEVQHTGIWNVEVFDVSVYGDLIGLLVHEHNSGAEVTYPPIMKGSDILSHNWDGMPTRLFVFSWDGERLRFLYNKSDLANDRSKKHALYMGPDYFLLRGSQPGNFSQGAFSFFKVDRKTWSVTPYANQVMSNIPASDQWVPKLFPDYFSLEKLTSSTDRAGRLFEPARINKNPDLDFYHIAGTKHFKVGDGFTEVTNFGTSGAISADIGNIVMGGDRYLAVENYEPQPGITATRYVHGRVNHGGLWKETISHPFNASVSDPLFFSLSTSLLSTGLIGFEYGTSFTGKIFFQSRFDAELMKRVSQVDTRTKGGASQESDGTLGSVTFKGGSVFSANARVPNFITSTKKQLASDRNFNTTFNFDEEIAPLNKADIGRHGLISRTQESTGPLLRREQGEIEVQNTYKTLSIVSSPDGNPLKEPVKVVVSVRTTEKSFLNHAYILSDTRFADFNLRNGAPQVIINKKGGDYRMSVTVFDNTVTVSKVLPIQTASYLFKGMAEPCIGTGADFCSNIGIPWFLELPATLPDPHSRPNRAVASEVRQYNTDGDLQASYVWHPKTLGGSGLYTLNGTVGIPSGHDEITAGKWSKAMEVVQRASNQPSNLSKHTNPVTIDQRGVKTTNFFGGPEGFPLATVRNSGKNLCSYLGGEEANLGSGWGAFGDWQAIGTVSTDMAHSGLRSLKTITASGPNTSIHFRQDVEFWSRKKGILVSGWIFAPGIANGVAAQDPGPGAGIELRASPNSSPIASIDLVLEYLQAKGTGLPYNKWVKLERLVTWEELNSVPYDPNNPGSDPVLRVWYGKKDNPGNQSPLPVYVDDLRIHPSDAAMTSQNFNARGLMIGGLNTQNNPVFPVYDAWGKAVGSKDERGRLFTTSANRMVEE